MAILAECPFWERDLNRLHHAGFSYGYMAYMDRATGISYYQVDAFKEDGPRMVCEGRTMAKAVRNLMEQLQRICWI